MTGVAVLAALLVWGLASAGQEPAGSEPAPGSPVVATVNGEAITVADLERHLAALHRTAGAGERRAFDPERLIFRVVNDVLLGQEARALGLDREPEIVARVAGRRRQLALQEIEQREIADQIRVTEEEVRQTFEDQYREITFQVLTAYERPQAEELVAALRAGADPETLARERSVDPYAPRGGWVRDVARIDLQREVAEVAFALAPGEIGGPVRTDLGWSVVRVEAHRPAAAERFPTVAQTLRQLVAHRQRQALRAGLAARLRERHPVTVDESAVAAVVPERLTDGRLMPRVAEPSAVVARVGSEVITAQDYGAALQGRWSGVRNEAAAQAAAPIILGQLIEERLLLAEALARGYGDLPEVRRALRNHETQLLIPRFLEEVVAAGVKVTREEMERYFADHRDEFRKPPRVRLGQVTVPSREEADRVAGLLRAGADLAWVARSHSHDRFRDAGGDRGWKELGGDELDQLLAAAAVGEVLDPYGAEGNFVVLQLLAREDQGSYAFAEVSGNVRQAVYERKVQAAVEDFMDRLRARSEIAIDEKRLATLQINGGVAE